VSISTALIARMYAATGFAVALATPLMHERLHAGKRACRSLQDLRDAPSGPYFARAMQLSRWRSTLLLRYLLHLSRPQLRAFFEDKVEYEGAAFARYALAGARPVILAAPHFGAAPVGLLAAIHRTGGHKPLSLYYDTQRAAPARLLKLFERGGMDATTLLGGFPGTLAAIRALTRNECLVMMPDAFDDITQTLVVPFFGRMLRVAAGTAFFALRTGAWVVPVFTAPMKQLGLRVTIGRPIDPHRFGTLNQPQAIFMLNRALFASFEREIRRSPEHWHHWERFPRISTAIEPPGRLEDDAPLRLLRDKCDAAPHLLQDLPELELLIK
jgi:lauroyl/myristoyl acyltransferase